MKSAEVAGGGSDFPGACAPVEEVRGICAGKDGVCGKVRVVKGDKRRWNDVALALNVHIARIDMMDAKDMRGIVEGVAGDAWFLQFAAAKLASTRRDRFRDEGETQNFGGIGVEGGISDGAAAIRDFRNGRKAAEQMRFRGRSPLRHSPEGVHQSARPIGKLIGEPPLAGEGRGGAAW